jgi:class 3 adenylate cyclase
LAWEDAGYPTVAAQLEQSTGPAPEPLSSTGNGQTTTAKARAAVHTHTFLPGLVENYAAQQGPPVRRELAVLFVDMADSTATVANELPEVALAHVQSFMEVVTDIAIAHCGDVKDYEGDGALLYFESVAEAARAALAMREALTRIKEQKGIDIKARFSLNIGGVVIGVIGTALRRSVALIGPSINQAARLLKHIPPGGVIATETAIERLRHEAPDLARRFQLWHERLELKGFQNELVTAFHVP